MTDAFVIEVDALAAARGLDIENEKIAKALTQALNKIIDRTRTMFDREIRRQVNFPASYLRPSSGRLTVSKKASRGDFEAVIKGRDRATSLARFTRQKPGQRVRGGGVKVRVKKEGGRMQTIPRAFLVNLNNGNLGLAVRTDGQKPPNAWKPKQLSDNVWLLYGPSVDQALISATNGKGVVSQMEGTAIDMLDAEFDRLLRLRGLV